MALALLDQPLAAALLRDLKRFRPVVSLAVHPLLQEALCALQLKLYSEEANAKVKNIHQITVYEAQP